MGTIDLSDNSIHGKRGKTAPNRRLSRSWYFLVGVTITTTIGLVVAVAPGLSEQLGSVWPWPNTHFVLLGGLAAAIISLVISLTVQQRRFTEIRGEVRNLEEGTLERERQNQARLRALLKISRMMGAVTRLEDIFDSVIDACIDLFDAQQASLMLVTEDTNELEVRAARGHLDQEGVKVAKRKVGEGVSGWVAENRTPLILGPDLDVDRFPELDVKVSNLTASVVVPVLLRNELIGVLSIRSREAGVRYGPDELQSLQVLAENIGTVIRHTEHVEWMRKTVEYHRTGSPGSREVLTQDLLSE
jgi:transcriptional regulator with GAF, ATPase, and Fis domain